MRLLAALVLFGWVSSAAREAPAAAPRVEPVVVARHPHDPAAFTEGLVLEGGVLFESTGLYGRSSLRKLDRTSGGVLASVELPSGEFGEGLAAVGDRLIQLTWQNGIAHVYGVGGLEEQGSFSFQGEGWGLCHDGARLVMSDGSDRLFFRDPDSFELLGSVAVEDAGEPVFELNELECVGSEVYANVWLSDEIVRIDAQSGHVLTRIDAANLRAADAAPGADVLNGIAFDPDTGRFLLTGKFWPGLYEVSLPVQAAAGSASAAPSQGSAGCGMPARPERQPATAWLVGAAFIALLAACRVAARPRSALLLRTAMLPAGALRAGALQARGSSSRV